MPKNKGRQNQAGMNSSVASLLTEKPSLQQGLETELEQTKKQLQIITYEWQETQKTLHQRNQQISALVTELMSTEQRVRQEISQALHDELQQLLFAMQVQVQFVSHSLTSSSQETLLTDVRQVKLMLDEALRITRRLTVEWAPPLAHS
ncbi:MAG: hypothetical protein KA314_21925 [Chloroflexi bacterium]|nr:hypothetical protein [Chloroflexota bacterium]MBP8058500.1 hypothetical protein [Chloroflexota bacterium]